MIGRVLTRRAGLGMLGLLILILLVLPLLLPPQSYLTYLLFTVFLYASFGHAWNLLAGYGGLLSFGNQVYIGIAGFALAILFYYGHVNVWLAWPVGGLVAALFAWLLTVPVSERWSGRNLWKPVLVALGLWALYELALVLNPSLDVFGQVYIRRVAILLLIFLGALPLLRLQGAYFAVATWLIAEAVGSVFNEWNLLGAGAGMQIKSNATIGQLYYAAFGLLVVATAAIWRVLRSRYGLALTAVRDDEEAAQTVGIDIRRVKRLVFLLAGALTGLAGGLYYIDAVIITPPSAFSVFWSAYFVFVVVAGGMGTVAGPIIGGALFVIVDRVLSGYLAKGLLVLGVVSILIILLAPRGVMGLVQDLRHRAARKDQREDARDASPTPAPIRALLGAPTRGVAVERRRPGVACALLVSGSPLPLMRPDNPPWAALVRGYDAARVALSAARPDALLIYSTQWIAVVDELWQARPRVVGLHVDENWHDVGNLRFDIRIDTALTQACIAGSAEIGVSARGVDYDGFPIDTGTIVAHSLLNPDSRTPLVVAANNIYHDWETTRRLGEMAVGKAVEQNKRVAVVGVGGLDGASFRHQIDLAEDRFASDDADAWNRDVLAAMENGDVDAVLELCPLYVKAARVDMGFKHFAWILGALGGRFSSAVVHGYGPTYGAGAAVVEFRV